MVGDSSEEPPDRKRTTRLSLGGGAISRRIFQNVAAAGLEGGQPREIVLEGVEG